MMRKIGERVIWNRAVDFLKRYRPQLIGVTGSTGKTITREAIMLALADEHPARTSSHSFQQPLDVALSILGVDHLHAHSSWFALLTQSLVKEVSTLEPETIVVEVGAHRPGDVDTVSQHFPFNVMGVTNVGTTHTHLFYSKDSVAHEIMSAIVTLPKDSVAVLNADDPKVAAMAQKTKARVILYGEAPEAHVRINRVDRLPSAGLAVSVVVDQQTYEIHVPHIIARHHVSKIVAAFAVAHALGVELPEAAKRLQNFVPPPGRLRVLSGKRNSVLLDDSYSASPEVTAAALATLKGFKSPRKIAILGDMTDLGMPSQKLHAEIGKLAAHVAQVVIVVGQEMREAGKEAIKAGVDVHQFDDAGEVGKWLVDFLQSGDVVLISGSRGMHMEQVVERLLADPNKDSDKLVRES